MLSALDEPATPPVGRTRTLRRQVVASPLLSPKGHDGGVISRVHLNDDDTERRITRQQRQAELKKRQQSLLSPVNALTSPKAARASITLPTRPDGSVEDLTLNASRSTLIAHPAGAVAALDGPSLPVARLTREQMTKTFDEWMKIAADNKINAKNSWNFALIDYFSDMSLLKEGDSINFQKASCTLDGCVKIYSSRVDSVIDETGKLLHGLTESHPKRKSSHDPVSQRPSLHAG